MNRDDENRIRVLVNALHARAGGGITYLRNLLPHLAAEGDLELHLLIDRSQLDSFGDLQGVAKLHVIEGHRLAWVLAWEQAVLPWLARGMRADVMFSAANYGPLLFRHQVVVLHNAVAVGRDEPRMARRVYWFLVGVATLLSVAVAKRILAVSDYAARMARFPPFRRKVDVVHHGVSDQLTPADDGSGREDFLLAVSDIYVQKNLLRLAQAIGRLKQRGQPVRLLIAGRVMDPDYYERLKATLAESGVADEVEFLGFRDFSEIRSLYRRCRAFVFPSTVESFGMPLVEAMACGAPAAAARAAAMPEVAGDAVAYFDPYDVDDMADTIGHLMRDDRLRRDLSARGVERAKAFNWAVAGGRTAKAIRAAGTRKR